MSLTAIAMLLVVGRLSRKRGEGLHKLTAAAHAIADIHAEEIPALINKLIRFLGEREIEGCIRRYKNSLQVSGPILREYYLRVRHPWWNAFVEYFELQKTGRSIRKNLTEDIRILASDAKKVTVLQKFMSEKIRHEYRKNLIDDNRAYDYLFEILIAWHFFLKGYEIKWHGQSDQHSEFLVKTPEFEFNVECKRISVDGSRKIRRKDFYRLTEKVLPDVQLQGYSGSVDIKLAERLHGDDASITTLATQILDLVKPTQLVGNFRIPSGSVCINLQPTLETEVNLHERLKNLTARKPAQAHGAIFARESKGRPVEPVEMTVESEKSDDVLAGIQKKLLKAAKEQLDTTKPGLIVCFLEGVDSLDGLAAGSGLQSMTSQLLAKESLRHIAAISYCSEAMKDRAANAITYSNQGLIFHNADCKFEKAKIFKYLA